VARTAWSHTRTLRRLCPKCRYDLRGLLPGSRCPECGTGECLPGHEGGRAPLGGKESPSGIAKRCGKCF